LTEVCFTLPGLPPSINTAYHYRTGGGKQRTPAAVAWQDGATLAIRAAATDRAPWPPRTPLAVFVRLAAPDMLRWDADNRVKALLDALAGCQALPADLQHERAALLAERDPLVEAKARAELASEQATALVEATRQAHTAAITAAKEAAQVAQAARRALARHEAAIAEVAAEIAALGA
jgi:Holliday junction resolvase RusA-like endonuclease